MKIVNMKKDRLVYKIYQLRRADFIKSKMKDKKIGATGPGPI